MKQPLATNIIPGDAHPKKLWLRIALINFFLAASLGALLRYAFVDEFSWLHFRKFLHAHSHVAMLGWVYMGLYALLIHSFAPDSKARKYKRLFWVTQLSVIGMLFSFPVQGYGPVSITFSTLHILCSYLFGWYFWRDLPREKAFSVILVKTSLLFMVISTLGVWAMGPIIALGLQGSAWYYMSVQFYLHFQFNGWYIFAILAMLFKTLEYKQFQIEAKQFQRFYFFLVAACLLTYALAVAWAKPLPIVFFVNSTGVILQLIALFFFFIILKKAKPVLANMFTGIEKLFLKLAFISFVSKIIAQSFVVLPFFAKVAYTIRNYVIGFIHLVLLGAVTGFIIAWALNQGLMISNKVTARIGLWMIFLGFLLSEGVLFLQGTMFWATMGFLPFYYILLFAVSALIPVGLALFVLAQFAPTRSELG